MAKAATNGTGPLSEELVRTLQDMSEQRVVVVFDGTGGRVTDEREDGGVHLAESLRLAVSAAPIAPVSFEPQTNWMSGWACRACHMELSSAAST